MIYTEQVIILLVTDAYSFLTDQLGLITVLCISEKNDKKKKGRGDKNPYARGLNLSSICFKVTTSSVHSLTIMSFRRYGAKNGTCRF